jgi:transposase-like protein
MDGFSCYNQIRMAKKDKEKTIFVMSWGTFCYKMMPFSLRNVSAMYQRAIVTLFHYMIHQEVEVYVDDILAKLKKEENYEHVLRKLFKRQQKYKLR